MTQSVGIIDYGMGNIQSVRNACEHLGIHVQLVNAPELLNELTHVILPGVGSFTQGMEELQKRGLVSVLQKAVKEKKFQFLGICLGMQLLADWGDEGGGRPGLGLIPGKVIHLVEGNPEAINITSLRVPHIGWNNVNAIKDSPLLSVNEKIDFYFVHSYYFKAQNPAHVFGTCEYGFAFPCVVGIENVFGVQFHPEKSHKFGLELLRRFFSLKC